MPWLRDVTAWLGMPLVPLFCDVANKNFEIWNSAMCNGAEKLLQENNDNIPNPSDEPIVYKQFKTGFLKLMGKEQAAQDPATFKAEVASEMLDHVGAGHETSAIALTYLYWELSKSTSLQAQLRAEVLTLSPQIRWPPSPSSPSAFALPLPKSIDALPLLHAIVMETLRLHAPIPGTEPRSTPKDGCTLGSYENIPGGVRVAAMPYTLHRNADVFPDPLAFKPERWLDASEEQTKEMLRWFWAFGSGGRMCIGSHLAIQEIKLIAAAIYGNWRTEIVDDGGVEEIDAYTTRPGRNALDLKFVRVE
jgi:cytochrome P450